MQWDLYSTRRDRIVAERKAAFDLPENEPINNIVPLTRKIMQQQCQVGTKFALHSGANEAYLFHGTKVSMFVSL